MKEKEINLIDALDHVFGKSNVHIFAGPKDFEQAEARLSRPQKSVQVKSKLTEDLRFANALRNFLLGAQKIKDRYLKQNDFKWTGTLSVGKEGPKFLQVIVDNQTQKSSYCWIDKTNGNVLKGSWKAPEPKNPRSNIYDDDYGVSGVDWHGAKYLAAIRKK